MPARRLPAGSALLILGMLFLTATPAAAFDEPALDRPEAFGWGSSASWVPFPAVPGSPPGVNSSDQREPDIAVDGARAHLVWVSNDSGRELVYHAWSFDLENWSLPRPLVPLSPAANASQPRVAATSGRVYVVWRETNATATTLALAASLDAGGNFTRAGDLTAPALPAATPIEFSIAASGEDLHAAWSVPTPDGGDTLVRTSKDAGLSLLPTWTVPGAGPQTSPTLARSAGTLLLAWEDGRNGEPDLFSSTSTDRGVSFSPPAPALADQAGKAQRRPGATFAPPATWWLSWEDEIAAKSYANVSWTPQPPTFPSGKGASVADVAPGSFTLVSGTGHGAWIDGPSSQALAARRLDDSYEAPQRPGNATGAEGQLRGAAYHDGFAVFVWTDSNSGDLDVRIARRDWGGPEVVIGSPAANTLVGGAGTQLSWSSTDPDGIDPSGTNISWSADLSTWSPSASGLGANDSILWKPPPSFNGRVYLRVSAADSIGNRAGAIVSVEADSVKPTAVAFDPGFGATRVPVGSSVTITFAELMVESSVEQGFKLFEGETAITCCFVWAGPSVRLDPNLTGLLEGRRYEVHLTGGRDLAGNSIPMPINYEFTTNDTTRPAVRLTSPTASDKWKLGSHLIAWNATDAGLILPGNVDIEYSADDGRNWSAVAYGLNNTGAYDWSVPTQITTSLALVRVRVTDLVGNVGNDTSSRFVIDSTPPRISSSNPENGTIRVDVDVKVRVNLSEPVNTDEVNATARLESKGPAINCGVSWLGGSSFTCSAGANLSSATVYHLNFSTHDNVRNRLEGSLWFRTRDSTPPLIHILSPKSSDLVNGATAFEIRYQYVDQFPHKPNSIKIENAYGSPSDNWTTITSVWNDPSKYFWRPAEIIEESASYVRISVRDEDGNLGSNISPAFRVDTIRPSVVGVEPKNGSKTVPLAGLVKFEFSEPMSSTRANASLTNVSGASLGLAWETQRTLSVTPSRDLAPNQQFGITLSDAFDEAGNAMAFPYRYSATTTSAPIPAQVRGIVVSSDGSLLMDVTVIARLQPADEIEKSNTTNRQGVFTMSGLTPGNYSFSFQLAGYQTRTVDHSLPADVLTNLPDVIMFPSGPTLPVYLPIYVLVLAVIGLLVLFVVISRRVKSSAEGEELKAYLRTAPVSKEPASEPMEDEEPQDDVRKVREKDRVMDIVDADQDEKSD